MVVVSMTVAIACSGGVGPSPSNGASPSPSNGPSPSPSNGPEHSTEPLTPPAGAHELTASETAGALADPAQAHLGVWSLLDHLGIGVYTGDGKQVLAGSEGSEADFWLYDFQIPVLERMATAPPIPFAEYADYLRAHGVTASAEEILAGYGAAYAKRADAFLVRLLNAANVPFSGAPSISPLIEWLLLLDATVPPNGGSAQGSLAHPPVAAMPDALVGERCSIGGDGRAPGFGIARSESDSIASAFGEAVTELPAQAMLIANSIVLSIASSPADVHEGHDGPGASESIDATAQVGQIPVVVNCGSLFGLLGTLYSVRGPVAGVQLTWTVPTEASAHGTLNVGSLGGGVSTTDASGYSHVSFDTIEEPSNGKGDPHDLAATVFAQADVRPALLAAGVSQVLVGLVPGMVPVRGEAIFRISWHDDSHHWTGTMISSSDDTVTAQDGGLVCSANWRTDLSLAVDAEGKISGTAVIAIQGAPVCTHPEFVSQTQVIRAAVTGTATDQSLHIEINPATSFEPGGSFDATGLTASIYGVSGGSAIFDIPVTSNGRAAGDAPRQLVSGANRYTSQNSISLTCADC